MSAKHFIMAVSAAILFAVVLFGCSDSDNNNPTGGGGTFTLTTNANPPIGGTVSPSGTSTHSSGTQITITARAANGYVFVNWTGDGIANENSVTTTVSMTENRSVIANFAEQTGNEVTFYCPDACAEQQGASRPSSCFTTQTACEESITPTCTPWQGNGCPEDPGYCGSDCTQSAREDCSGSFYQNRPATCDTQGGGEGTFTDSRDGQTYRYVTIGTQTWMAENLSFNADGSWCNGNDANNCNGYGRHYDWATAMNLPSTCNTQYCASQIQTPHQGICPSGWHLPTDEEWDVLMTTVGGSNTAGRKLKSTSGWSENGNGTDDFGFSALPGGNRWDGSFDNVGHWGLWWPATEVGAGGARSRGMGYDGEYVYSSWDLKSIGFSVRCVRD